jgi:hypothetical protein
VSFFIWHCSEHINRADKMATASHAPKRAAEQRRYVELTKELRKIRHERKMLSAERKILHAERKLAEMNFELAIARIHFAEFKLQKRREARLYAEKILQVVLYSGFLDGDTGMALYNGNLITMEELFGHCHLTTRDLMKPGNPIITSWQRDSLVENAKKMDAIICPKYKRNYMLSTTPWKFEYLWASYYGRLDWVQFIMQSDPYYFTALNGAAIEWAFHGEHVELIAHIFAQLSGRLPFERWINKEIAYKAFVRSFLEKVKEGQTGFIGGLLDAMGTGVKAIFEEIISNDYVNYDNIDKHGYPHIIDAAVESGNIEMLDLLYNATCLQVYVTDEVGSLSGNDETWLLGGHTCIPTAYENGRVDILQILLTKGSPFVEYYLYRILRHSYKECLEFLLERRLWIPTATHYQLLSHCANESSYIEDLVYTYLPEEQKALIPERYNMKNCRGYTFDNSLIPIN